MLPGLVAVPARWRSLLGADFDAFRPAFLRTRPERARSIPCPEGCGCAHDIVDHGSGKLVAVCTCDPWNCDDIPLKPEDVVLLELNRAKLGKAISSAFGLQLRASDFGLPMTTQVGAYGSSAVLVVLTIQHDLDDFRRVVAELCARLREPFILLSPTNRFIDAKCKELLAASRSGFFDLESHVSLTAQGNLQARYPASELFARFTPQDREPIPEDVARQAFALVQRLDSERVRKPPTMLTVFKLYCVKELTAEQVANRCGCSKSTIINRLKLLRAEGLEPEQLRRYSAHLDQIEESIRDERAKRIHRRDLIDPTDPDEPDE